ncbi:hypothetical protein MPTK1_5g01810 [Marchantia polymorpha subsp. ruderalis]|uniref:Uncharacterized protein n=2 Tax=Marchantia polymorpha TaxID=3197 RepID=A0AAF6BDW8_MARPO|nr:hypothetical protein MARPO_0161s0023 [Marchantia polymorpha]BBN10202.1 hypothetical protein Mp_5g01810 [Marchantia polymorpha subsp. ruderalis]|eukprot:PTQ28525.1 hypothetical protein MARPO_0161s0023 [Marchantia polymorpha]
MADPSGLIAAVAAMVFFGSYAVPLKFPVVVAAQVDPIVYQTYKSFACFATSWLVLIYVPLRFTWWGMVGASMWCTTGIVAIMAVRLAGIGVAQSLWSGIGIFVSYIWGAYVFNEPIKHPLLSMMALGVMAVGMMGIGMAASGSLSPGPSRVHALSPKGKTRKMFSFKREEEIDLIQMDGEAKAVLPRPVRDEKGGSKYRRDNKFLQGILCAIFVGVSNGSFLIPFKYATKEIHGVEYLVSFGVGAVTISSAILTIYSMLQVYRGKPPPSFHFKAVAGPGLLTGVLWSAGNVCSIVATEYLGMALGWPLVQCQLLVSAMWAVFYYEEVSGRKAASVLLGSCGLVVVGAMMLSKFGTI